MMEGGQELGPSVVMKGKLEIRQKIPGKSRKFGMRRRGLINLPLRSFTCKHLLEQPKMDRVIGNGVRCTPHVERSNLICRIFSSKTFKLGDVGRELGRHSRPTSIMVYRVIDQLVKIGKIEAAI